MDYFADYTGLSRYDLENELSLPRARLIHGDYALVPLRSSRRAHSSHHPLTHYTSDGVPFGQLGALGNRSILHPVRDAALVDRDGPYRCSSCTPRCEVHPQTHDDLEYLDIPHPGWHFPYAYPLSCMEPGGLRWGSDQIQEYNRDVLRHNNQIARRRSINVPAEYMMLHPMMDSLSRFSPGFDSPRSISEFLAMEGKQHSPFFCQKPPPMSTFTQLLSWCYLKQLLTLSTEPLLDSHRHHYGLPYPEALQRALLLNIGSLHRHLCQLKQIQFFELFGAARLAEQSAIQLLTSQNAFPGLSIPRNMGISLGPDFEDMHLSPLRRSIGGLSALDAIGYGRGLSNWNYDILPQLLPARATAVGGRGLPPWAGYPGIYPGTGAQRGHPYPGSWPGSPFSGAEWPGFMGGGYDPRRMGIGGGGGLNSYERVAASISCDGGGRNRPGRF